MGIRVAAVLVAAVVAVALGAAILATHHGPGGSLPAGINPNVKAYRNMVMADYNTMSASTSNNCNTIADPDCAAAIGRVVPTLQQWVGDLSAFSTPASLVAIDGQLRVHLSEGIIELNAALAFQKAHNQKGFDLAMNAADYERAWIDPAVFTIEGIYPRVAASFADAANVARQGLEGCQNSSPGPGDIACTALFTNETCTGSAVQKCESDVQSASTRLQEFVIGLTQNLPPSGLGANAAQVLPDLVNADTALEAITDGLIRGDQAKVAAGEFSFSSAITTTVGDLSAT